MQTEPFQFFTDDYGPRLEELARRAREAERQAGAPLRMGESSEYDEINHEYQELKAEAEQRSIRGKIRALPRPEWRKLKEKHPPRTEGDEEARKQDRVAGVNVEDVEDDLVFASLVEPDFKSRAAFDEWVADNLSEGEWQYLVTRAWFLTRGAGTDPKSLPASLTPSGSANGG